MVGEKYLSKTDTVLGLVVAAGFGSHFIGLVDFPWFIDWPVAIWFYTVWGFFALVHAQAVMLRGGGEWWIRHLAPLLVLFIPADALFNLLFGSYIFKELPHWPEEFLFSKRVERHFLNVLGESSPEQQAAGSRWHDRLRAVDPIGHDYTPDGEDA
jgi:hypothetical protein